MKRLDVLNSRNLQWSKRVGDARDGGRLYGTPDAPHQGFKLPEDAPVDSLPGTDHGVRLALLQARLRELRDRGPYLSTREQAEVNALKLQLRALREGRK